MPFKSIIKKALQEDIGRGELYSLVGENSQIKANIICKQNCVFGGEIIVKQLCELTKVNIDLLVKDGQEVKSGDIVANLQTDFFTYLKIQRTLVNFIQHISGIATKTREFVNELKGYDTLLLDTRKTHPGLRLVDKYAVRCGGGTNHRMGGDA